MSNKLLQFVAGNQYRSDSYLSSVDLHVHTNYTDGKDSVMDMHLAACEHNLSFILFSEHARASSISWFPFFAAEVRELPNENCKALVGVEARIYKYDGELDTCKEILELCDLVVASVHRFPGEENILDNKKYSSDEALELEYSLSCAALSNPHVDILGHPFGMSISRFKIEPNEQHWISLIKLANEKNVAIEINARYHRNIIGKQVTWCRQIGTVISPSSDAHSKDQVGNICSLIKEYL